MWNKRQVVFFFQAPVIYFGNYSKIHRQISVYN